MEHVPVMPNEVIEALAVRPDGIYVDATFGRGGHARLVLQSMGPDGRLFALDQDPEAISAAQVMIMDQRFSVRQDSFAKLRECCDDWGISGRISGLLLDLGVSSPQLDNAARGFSFLQDGPLDMRMNPDARPDAGEWLNSAEEKDIADILWRFGEERHARRIARKIVTVRAQEPLVSTRQLAGLVESAYPRGERHKHPATRSFQAIRIFINRELEALESALEQSVSLLGAGGRLVVISFHSLEDRMVKRFMRAQSAGVEAPRHLPVRQSRHGQTMRLIGRAVKAGAEEVRVNPRSRSAVLRVAEKLH